jgi:diguanylate cyclase (GGDEF)-like protein
MKDASPSPPLPSALAEADRLPTLPSVTLEVLQLTRNSDATLDNLAEVISRDPALAAKLLSFANSLRYGLGTEVTTLQRAAMVLGLKSVQMLSLGFSLATNLPKSGSTGFDYEGFWSRSLARAVAGRTLADSLTLPIADEAFLCGLLSGIGQLVSVECLPDLYSEVIERHGTRLPSAAQEKEALGFDRRDVSFALFDSWGMPELICLGVAHFEDPTALPAGAPPHAAPLVGLLNVAAAAVDVLQGEDKGRSLQELHRSAFVHLDFEPETIERFLVELGPPIQETAKLLDLGRTTAVQSSAIVEEAREQLVQLGMETAHELQTQTQQAQAAEYRQRLATDPDRVDPVTGLLVAETFHALLDGETAARIRGTSEKQLGLILFEVDGYHDQRHAHGEEFGDAALRHVGATVHRKLRESDVVAYLGEARYGILIPECSTFGLKVTTERIRRFIEDKPFAHGGSEHALTVSLGGATMNSPRSLSDGEKLLEVVAHLLAGARPNTVALLRTRFSSGGSE